MAPDCYGDKAVIIRANCKPESVVCSFPRLFPSPGQRHFSLAEVEHGNVLAVRPASASLTPDAKKALLIYLAKYACRPRRKLENFSQRTQNRMVSLTSATVCAS